MRRLLYILIILSVIFVYPSQVYAASLTITVDGEGTSTQGAYVGVGNFTDVQTNDGDGTYLRITAFSGFRHGWTFTNLGGGSINSVTVHGVVRRETSSGNGGRLFTRIGTTNFDASAISATALYVDYSYTWANSPATGIAWTLTELNAAQFGLWTESGITDNVRLTQIYVVVDYTLAAPSVTTDTATNLGSVNATLNGNMTSTGGASVTQRGFVYDTVTRVAPGNVAPVASGYVSWWTDNSTAFSAGTFPHITGGLASCTEYFYRAFARNSQGYTYGDEVSFTTVCTPAITTVAATNIAATTAQLNSSVTSDGGQASDVRFGYDTVTHAGAFAGYPNITAWVENTYTTGDLPYVNITGLTAGTVYYFNVQIRNDTGTAEGTERAFAALSGVNEPTELRVQQKEDDISASWITGDGASGTLVRVKQGGYPTSVTDGTELYRGTGNSIVYNNVTAGTNYYFMAWGYSGVLYSSDNATVFMTAQAYTSGGVTLIDPGFLPKWVYETDISGLSRLPFYGIINAMADSYSMPHETLWIILAFIFPIAGAIIAYTTIPSGNYLIAIVVLVVGLVMGVIMGILAGAFVVLYVIIAIGIGVVGHRL